MLDRYALWDDADNEDSWEEYEVDDWDDLDDDGFEDEPEETAEEPEEERPDLLNLILGLGALWYGLDD